MKETLGFVRFVKLLLKDVSAHDVSGAAAELSYRFFLALFPFMIFLAALGGFVAEIADIDNPTDQVMDALGESLPADSASVLRTQIDEVVGSQSAGLLSFGILLSVWAASSGIATIMKAMNRAYEVRETRKLWKRYAMSIGLTALGGGALILAFVLSIAGQVYGYEIADELGLNGVARTAFPLARVPLAIIAILTAVSLLYWAAPNARLHFRLITPGAVLFTAGWLIVSALFGLYVANFGNYNATYGTLGAVVIAMIWFYITAFILLLGAELNAVIAKLHEQQHAKAALVAEEGAEEAAAKAAANGGKSRTERVLPVAMGAALGIVGRFRRKPRAAA